MTRIWRRVITIALVPGVAGPAAAGSGKLGQPQDPDHARHVGARWLVKHQNADGGWGAGVWGQDVRRATSDVATTSIATRRGA